jgi:hypothetical protein
LQYFTISGEILARRRAIAFGTPTSHGDAFVSEIGLDFSPGILPTAQNRRFSARDMPSEIRGSSGEGISQGLKPQNTGASTYPD